MEMINDSCLKDCDKRPLKSIKILSITFAHVLLQNLTAVAWLLVCQTSAELPSKQMHAKNTEAKQNKTHRKFFNGTHLLLMYLRNEFKDAKPKANLKQLVSF